MRYYKIVISDPKTGKIFVPNFQGKTGFSLVDPGPYVWTYCSLYPGGNPQAIGSGNPAALAVEWDIPVGFMHAPIGNPYIKINGVSLQEISQGSDLNWMNIAVYGGMSKGLPLENPTQIGLLCSGQIYQAFGNWIGTSQYLAIYVQAGGSSANANTVTGFPAGPSTLPAPTTNANPAYLVFQWKPGQPLLTPVAQTLATAYPQYNIQGAVHSGLVWTGMAATGFYANLSTFAQYLNKASINLIGGYAPDIKAYMGVCMTLQNNTISIFDGTVKTAPKMLLMTDLIGQPTWVDATTMQATTILRGDIQPGNYVTLPNGPLTITANAQTSTLGPPAVGSINTQLKNRAAFQGTYLCTAVHHVGSSRDGQGMSWVTTLDLLLTAPLSPKDQAYALSVLARPNRNAYGFFVPQ